MSKYSNNANLPVVVAAWLTLDEYDYNPDENTISATTIIKPIQQIILGSRLQPEDVPRIDVIDRFNSMLGNAIHNEIERFWRDPRKVLKALKELGIPGKRASRITVNAPEEWYAQNPDAVRVVLERRMQKEVGGMLVTGKADIIYDGEVMDNKVTNVFNYIYANSHDHYSQQGSVYKWLDPLVTSDHTNIIQFFKDWRKYEQMQNKVYPATPIIPTRFEIADRDETQEYLEWKVSQILRYKDTPTEKLPECDEDDLWMDAPQYKYFAKPDNQRATRVFDDEQEAKRFKAKNRSKNPEGVIRTTEVKAKACAYCDVRNICAQYKRLEKEGLLA